MERDDVGLAQELVERHERRAELPLGVLVPARVGVQDAHREALRAPRERAPDAAHPHDAERRVVHVAPEEHRRCPATELAGANEALGFAESPRGREQQREDAVRGRLVQDARRERYRYATLLRRADVDVVVAGPHGRDHAQLAGAAYRVPAHRVRGKRVHDVGLTDGVAHFVGCRDRRLRRPDRHVSASAQRRERDVGDRPRDDDPQESWSIGRVRPGRGAPGR